MKLLHLSALVFRCRKNVIPATNDGNLRACRESNSIGDIRMPAEATRNTRETDLRTRLERAAEESRSPVHPVYGWNDLKRTVSGLFKKSESTDRTRSEDVSRNKR